jgi:hypothetical protein
MEKIVTQGCYLLAKYQDATHFLNDDTPLKEYDNMIVLTKEQYEADKRKMVEDAYTAGAEREYELSVHGCSSEPDKEQYLTQLFGVSEIKEISKNEK